MLFFWDEIEKVGFLWDYNNDKIQCAVNDPLEDSLNMKTTINDNMPHPNERDVHVWFESDITCAFTFLRGNILLSISKQMNGGGKGPNSFLPRPFT